MAASFLFLPHPAESGFAGPILNVGWTLNFEMFFYALFALALLLPRRHQLAALTVVCVALYATRLIGLPRGVGLFWTSPIMFEFVAGAWAGAFWRRRRRAPSRAGWLPIVAAVPLVVLLYAMEPVLGPYFPLIDRTLLLVPALLVLAGVLMLEGSDGSIPRWKLPALLGDASYSIYLFHRFGIFLVSLVAVDTGLPPAATCLVALLVSTGLGVGIHLILERPLLSLASARPKVWRAASGTP